MLDGLCAIAVGANAMLSVAMLAISSVFIHNLLISSYVNTMDEMGALFRFRENVFETASSSDLCKRQTACRMHFRHACRRGRIALRDQADHPSTANCLQVKGDEHSHSPARDLAATGERS